VASHLVEHGTLHRQNAPVRLVGRMRTLEDVERLLEIAGIRERAPIGAEQDTVVGIVQRRGLEHGRGLRALVGRAQGLRIADRIVGIARIGAKAFTQCLAVTTPIGITARRRGR
jgi:hypothetical protein